MAITLDGTSGITTPDVNSDGLTVDSTTLVVDEANNRVGIGTSSPAVRLNVTDSSDGGNSGTIRMGSDGTYYGQQQFRYNSSEYRIGVYPSGNMTFYTKGSESARIDSNGNLLVGNTSFSSYGKITVQSSTTADGIQVHSNTTSSTTQIAFKNPNGYVGVISSSGSSTAYATSSDYRLKENVVGVIGASARVQQLNPVRFNFIADPAKTVDGFLAHEVQDVVPEAITGTKDAVDADGNPEYQGIDQSKLVPLLTAALQEALTKIETLEARVAALEAA